MSNVIDFRRRSAGADRPQQDRSAPFTAEEFDALPLEIRQEVSRIAMERRPKLPERKRNVDTMHTFVFRSYDLIIEADPADLVRDVGLDLHKARVKLRKIRERIISVREQAVAQIERLTLAEAKMTAAIEVAEANRSPAERP